MAALSDIEVRRALAIERLGFEAYELAAQGHSGEAIDKLSAARRELEKTAPEEQIGPLEIDVSLGWELFRVGEHQSAERILFQALGAAGELEREFGEAGEADEPKPVRRRRFRRGEQRTQELARLHELAPAQRLNRVIAHLSNHLGVFHTSVTHDDQRAADFLEEAVRRHTGSPRAWLMLAQSLANLANVYSTQDRPAEARASLERALETLEQDPALTQTGEYVRCQATLAMILDASGDEDAAEPHFRRAFESARALAGAALESVANVQGGLGSHLLRWGCPGEAEVHLRQALRTSMVAGRKTSPEAATARTALIMALWAGDRLQEAASLLAEATRVADRNLLHELEIGSEELRLRASALSRFDLDLALSIAWATPEDEAIVKVAFDAVVRRKAMLTEILMAQRADQREHQLEAVREALVELDQLRERQSEALLASESEEVIAELTAEIRRREEVVGVLQRLTTNNPRHLSSEGPDRARRAEYLARWGGTGEDFTKALPEGAALIEYVRFIQVRKRPWEETEVGWRYLAFVCSADGALAAIPLGEAEIVDGLVEDLAAALEHDGAAMEAGTQVAYEDSATETACLALRRAVFEPLVGRLRNVRSLIIAPDGALGHVPFNVLPAPAGAVIDDFEVTYVSGGRDLARPRVASSPSGAPLVIADPDYDAGSTGNGGGSESAQRLEFTRLEGLAIARMLGVEPVLDAEATEVRLKGAQSPQILHCATHGWYLPPDAHHPRLARLAGGGVAGSLARSGLVLAGFNSAWATGARSEEFGDGLLTAGEVAALDLTGTQLVALSACETGLGQVVYLEGSIGLRRAFLMAGARAVLYTLWSVPDGPTLELMKGFYRRLLDGEARSTALSEAQREVRERSPHPHLWGGFALQGDPGPLDEETLARLREASPEVEEEDTRRGAQRRLTWEALRRSDVAVAQRRATALAEAGDAMGEMILAHIAVERGDVDEGERRYVLAAQRGETLAARALASLKTAADDVDGAEHWLRLAVANGDTDSKQDLASLLRRRDERDEALRFWREGAEEGNPACLYAMGNEADLDGNVDEAMRWWERAAEAGVDNAAYNLAATENERGNEQEAERWWRRAAELGHPDAAKHFAMAANEAGRHDEAIELWRGAALNGDVESAHNLGVKLQDTRPLEAEYWYQSAADAGMPQAANNLAALLAARGDREGAAHYWQVAAEAGHAVAPIRLGDLLLSMGRVDDACRWLRPAAEAGAVAAAEVLARALDRRGEADEAHEWRMRAADGGHPLAAHAAAKEAIDSGDLERAVKLLEVAAEGGDVSAFTTYGDLEQDAGRTDDAEKFWKTAADHGDAEALSRLGLLHFRRGRTDEARSALTAAREAGQADAEHVLRLLAADEARLRSRAERGHLLAMTDLFALAAVREDEAELRRWMLAAAEAGDTSLMVYAGHAAAGDGDNDAARRWYVKAADQEVPEAAEAMAALCAREGSSEEAAQWSDRAARLTAASAAFARGLAAHANGDPEAAEAAWREGAEAGSAEAATNLAVLLMERGDHDAAEASLRQAVDRFPAAANALAGILAARGDDSGAEHWFTHAIDLARGR